jgi:hypothetical protein
MAKVVELRTIAECVGVDGSSLFEGVLPLAIQR